MSTTDELLHNAQACQAQPAANAYPHGPYAPRPDIRLVPPPTRVAL